MNFGVDRRMIEDKDSDGELMAASKFSWPELVEANGDSAVATTEQENKNVEAILIREVMPMILDYRLNRIFVWVDENNVVTRTPVIGYTTNMIHYLK
ncbi:hypothetical protein GH714_003408 [Hevea brasiliensis]|uniref:Uncharacterized protein n=1 Tax=Hevea brasiliensis TaxID=3981 RepID=A0A6A6MBB2_HEVBR|nr:hypothetical protein GH714_003408 [Hevea brasiliensis]